uniref:transmembrane cell adhesion receptor mua-3-like n=1 Tax=Euleptes europaea TaxID=460621 RepID=UPI00254068F2|nr:transmembrane cell adhesion receptor mua-3-like [Euleptes europaea]
MDTDQNTTYTEVEDAVTDALRKSTALKVDPNSTSVQAIPLCELGNNYCSKYASCLSNGETSLCQCRPGFKDPNPMVPGKTCKDIDECSNKTDDCSYLASCINTIGSYECQCYPGMKDMNLTNPGRMCQDPTMCFNRTDFCSLPTNECLDTQYYICSSKQAFACRILFKNWNFIFPDLYNSESETYRNLSGRMRKTVVKGMASKLGVGNFNIIMVGYQNGSLIAYFVLLIHGPHFIETRRLAADLTEVIQTMLDNQTEVTVQALGKVQDRPPDSQPGPPVTTSLWGPTPCWAQPNPKQEADSTAAMSRMEASSHHCSKRMP